MSTSEQPNEGGQVLFVGEPTPRDITTAIVWQEAKNTGHPMWAELSDEQRAMVEKRIEWCVR